MTTQSLDCLYWPVLVPHLEPGRGNRLYLIRREGPGVRNLFDDICEEWQRLALAYSGDDFYVYALPEKTTQLRSPGVELFGVPFISHCKPIGSAFRGRNELTFMAMCGPGAKSAFANFVSLATRAGVLLRAAANNKSRLHSPSNPAAAWLAAMWSVCKPEPAFWVVTKNGPRQPKSAQGSTWRRPFESAVQTAISLGLVKVDKGPVSAQPGEYSDPLSKTEIAQRLEDRKSARARDLAKYGTMLKLKPVEGTKNKWIVLLDALPPNYRPRLVGRK